MGKAPTIAFPGGKARLAQEIVALLPQHGRTYIEPFAGRGNLYWSAVSAGLKYEKWWLNDIATIPFFRAIKEIGHAIQVPEHNRDEYERQRAASTSSPSYPAVTIDFHRQKECGVNDWN
jgi:site-specific DNA-adenine methylase